VTQQELSEALRLLSQWKPDEDDTLNAQVWIHWLDRVSAPPACAAALFVCDLLTKHTDTAARQLRGPVVRSTASQNAHALSTGTTSTCRVSVAPWRGHTGHT
jgi:hypothetical protein